MANLRRRWSAATGGNFWDSSAPENVDASDAPHLGVRFYSDAVLTAYEANESSVAVITQQRKNLKNILEFEQKIGYKLLVQGQEQFKNLNGYLTGVCKFAQTPPLSDAQKTVASDNRVIQLKNTLGPFWKNVTKFCLMLNPDAKEPLTSGGFTSLSDGTYMKAFDGKLDVCTNRSEIVQWGVTLLHIAAIVKGPTEAETRYQPAWDALKRQLETVWQQVTDADAPRPATAAAAAASAVAGFTANGGAGAAPDSAGAAAADSADSAGAAAADSADSVGAAAPSADSAGAAEPSAGSAGAGAAPPAPASPKPTASSAPQPDATDAGWGGAAGAASDSADAASGSADAAGGSGGAGGSADVQDLQKQLRKALAEVEQAKEYIRVKDDEVTAWKARVGRRDATVTKLQDTNKELKAQKTGLETQRTTELEQQKTGLEAAKTKELADLQNKLDTQRTTELEQQKTNLDAEKTKELADLQTKLDTQRATDLQQQKTEMEAANTKDLADLQTKLDTQRATDLEQQKTNLEATKKIEIDDLKQKLTTALATQNDDEKNKELTNQLAEEKVKSAELQKQVNGGTKLLADAMALVKTANEDASKKVKDAKDEIQKVVATAEAEKRDLEDEIKKLRAVNQAKDAVVDTQQRLAEAVAERKILEEEVKKLRAAGAQQAQQAQQGANTAAAAEIARLTQALKDSEAARAQVTAGTRQIVQFLDKTKQDLADSKAEVQTLHMENQQLKTAAAAAPINASSLTANEQQQAKFITYLLNGYQLFTIIGADFDSAVTADFIWQWVWVLLGEERELVRQLINTDARAIQEKRKQILRYIWHNRFQITKDHEIWSTATLKSGYGGGFRYAAPGDVGDPVPPTIVKLFDYQFATDNAIPLTLDANGFTAYFSKYENAFKAPAAGSAAGGVSGGSQAGPGGGGGVSGGSQAGPAGGQQAGAGGGGGMGGGQQAGPAGGQQAGAAGTGQGTGGGGGGTGQRQGPATGVFNPVPGSPAASVTESDSEEGNVSARSQGSAGGGDAAGSQQPSGNADDDDGSDDDDGVGGAGAGVPPNTSFGPAQAPQGLWGRVKKAAGMTQEYEHEINKVLQ